MVEIMKMFSIVKRNVEIEDSVKVLKKKYHLVPLPNFR